MMLLFLRIFLTIGLLSWLFNSKTLYFNEEFLIGVVSVLFFYILYKMGSEIIIRNFFTSIDTLYLLYFYLLDKLYSLSNFIRLNNNYIDYLLTRFMFLSLYYKIIGSWIINKGYNYLLEKNIYNTSIYLKSIKGKNKKGIIKVRFYNGPSHINNMVNKVVKSSLKEK